MEKENSNAQQEINNTEEKEIKNKNSDLESEISKEENEEISPTKEQDEKIAVLEKEAAEWKDSYIRKVAEFQNYTKRRDREIDEFRKYASEKIIVKVVEVMDNLERALQSSNQTKDFDSLVKGVEMTFSQLKRVIQEEGVEALESVGKEFNPYEHHAMMQEENKEFEHNTVIAEFQKGYKMKDKVIRPALVKVAKNK